MSGCYVTIYNDAKLNEGSATLKEGGLIHTWAVVYRPGEEPVTISFSPAEGYGITGDVPGQFDPAEHLINRKTTSTVTHSLSRENADAIVDKFGQEKLNPPKYDSMPDGNGDQNCVTELDKVLQAGDVHYLAGIQNPYAVDKKINGGDPNDDTLENLLDKKDALDEWVSDAWNSTLNWVQKVLGLHHESTPTQIDSENTPIPTQNPSDLFQPISYGSNKYTATGTTENGDHYFIQINPDEGSGTARFLGADGAEYEYFGITEDNVPYRLHINTDGSMVAEFTVEGETVSKSFAPGTIGEIVLDENGSPQQLAKGTVNMLGDATLGKYNSGVNTETLNESGKETGNDPSHQTSQDTNTPSADNSKGDNSLSSDDSKKADSSSGDAPKDDTQPTDPSHPTDDTKSIDFNYELERFFASLQLSQSIDAVGDAFKHGDTVSQVQALAVLAVSIDRWAEVNGSKEWAEIHGVKDLDNMTLEQQAQYRQFQNQTGLSNDMVMTAKWAASVAGTIQAFRYGDDLDKVGATLNLANTATTGGNPNSPLGGVVSAINTYQSARAFDDALNSGDKMAIAQSGTTLVYNAGMTYNAYAAYSGASQISGIEYLGYAIAAMQIADKQYVHGAVTAVSTYLYSTGNGYCIAAGIVLQLADMFGLFGKDEPPSASAHFYVDDTGHVTLGVGGDNSDIKDVAKAYGQPILQVLQSYADNGGRLVIPGEQELPRIQVTAGDQPLIIYGNQFGTVYTSFSSLEDGARAMLGVVAARDCGAYVSDAIRVSTDTMGHIDTNNINAYMAGMGFGRNGATFTRGEDNSPREGHAMGTGIFTGGGQNGPVGQVMGVTGIISLPLRPDQLPSQTIGKIRGTTDLGQTFTGAGSGLLLAAMLASAAEPPSAEAGAASAAGPATTQGSSVPPSTGSGGTVAAAPKTAAEVLATLHTDEEITAYLDKHWGELKALASVTANNAPPNTGLNGSLIESALNSAYLFSQLNATPTGDSGTTASVPYDPFPFLATVINNLPHTEPVSGTLADSFLTPAAQSFSGGIVQPPSSREVAATPPEGVEEVSAQPSEGVVPEPPPIPIGITVSMAEDTALRLVGHQLMENGTLSSEALQFSSLGTATHGRVWIDDNGDIRFQPDADFVGTAGFSYFLRQPDGELVERLAVIGVQNVNDAPVAMPDHITLQQGQAFFLDALLQNDTDVDGDGLVLDHLRGVEHGQIMTIDGRLAFVPDIDFTGDIELSYFVRDHIDTYPVRGTVTVTVEQADTAPVAGDDHFLIAEDKKLTVDPSRLLRNDNDGDDGDKVAFAGLGEARHGTVTQAADGSIVFTPEKGYIGSEAGFYYQIQDSTGNTSQGWASVGIVDVRHAPEQIANSLSISEDQPLLFDAATVAKFLADADGDKLFVEEVHAKSGGTVTVQNGLYLFTPEKGFTGTASFDYRANDGLGGVVTGTVKVLVEPVDKPPVMGEDKAKVDEDGTLYLTTKELLANDHDPEKGDLTFAGLGAAKHGSVTLTEDGRIEFRPDKDYNGNEAGFFYTAKDTAGNSGEGWVKVVVNPVNDAPVVVGHSLTINEDQSLAFTADVFGKFVYDADGEKFHFQTAPKLDDASSGYGRFEQKDGVYTFIPKADYNGSITFSYTVANDSGEKLSDTLTIVINPVNDATKFGDITLTTDEDQAMTLAVSNLVDKATDADGALSFAGVGEAKHGTVTVGDDGLITFTPDADYFGKEAGFFYTLKDADGNLAEGWAKVAIKAVNDAPVVTSQTLTINEDERLAFTPEVFGKFVYDADGEKFHFQTAPKLDDASSGYGRFEQKDGVYTFIPKADYHGSITFSYTVVNDSGEKLSDTLTIAIQSQDDPTVFTNVPLVTDEEQALTVSTAKLAAAAKDADGALHFVGLGQAQHGTVALGEDGNIVFTPDTDYFGKEAGFSYKLQDVDGYISEGFAKVTVNNVNDVPVVISDTIHINEDESFTFDDLGRFFFDADGDKFHFLSAPKLIAADSGHGHFEKKDDTYTFVPTADFYGTVAFTYAVANDSGERLTGSMDILIDPVNDLPQAPLTKLTGNEDHVISIDLDKLLAGVKDVEDGNYAAGKLRFDISDSINGNAWVGEDGKLYFQAKDDYFGAAEVRYTIQDSEGGLGTGYIQYDIKGVQDAPLAKDDDQLTLWSNKGYVNVVDASRFLANDYDADGDTLSITKIVGQAEFGKVWLDADGIHYTAPSVGWIGVDSFTYKIADGHNNFSEATVEFDVKPNTSPDLKSEVIFSSEDVVTAISQYDLLKNDNDIDGDKLTITSVDQAQHCTVTLLPDGSIAFAPDLNYNNDYYDYLGPVSFRYTVSDGISAPVSAIAVVSLTPVNDAPVLASDVLLGGVEDNTYVFSVDDLLKNDWDVERDSPYEKDNIHVTGVWGAAHGSLVYDQVTGIITYTPGANFCTPNPEEELETFYYQITDDGGLTTVGQSYIYVLPVNDIPVVEFKYASGIDDSIETRFKIYGDKGLLDHDSDADNDRLYIKDIGDTGSSKVYIDQFTNELVVIPAFGTKQLTIPFVVTDNHGGDVPTSLTISDIREHQFAPTYVSNMIEKVYYGHDFGSKTSVTAIIHFQFTDPNRDLVSISASLASGGHGTVGELNVHNGTQVSFDNNLKLNTAIALNYNPDGSGSLSIPFTVTAIDATQRSGTVLAWFDGHSLDVHNVNSPVVLDLNGNGINLLAADAGTHFDWNGDGIAEQTGWVGPNDGILAYDFNGDGHVTMAQEISFKDYQPGAVTDLQGLAHFDTNGDGVLDKNDNEWVAFGVWRDAVSNTLSGDGEFKSLEAMGIASLSLTSDNSTVIDNSGNVIYGIGSYTTVDGQTHVLGDIGLTGEKIEVALSDDGSLAPLDSAADTGKNSTTPSLAGDNSNHATLAATPASSTMASAASTLAPTDDAKHDSTTSTPAQKDNSTGHDSNLAGTADKTALAQTDTTGHAAPNEALAAKATPASSAQTDTASHAASNDASGNSLASAGQHDSAPPTAATPPADAPHADLPPPAMPSLDAIAIQLASDMATAPPSDYGHGLHDPGPVVVVDTIADHDTNPLHDDQQHQGFLG